MALSPPVIFSLEDLDIGEDMEKAFETGV